MNRIVHTPLGRRLATDEEERAINEEDESRMGKPLEKRVRELEDKVKVLETKEIK